MRLQRSKLGKPLNTKPSGSNPMQDGFAARCEDVALPLRKLGPFLD